MRNSEWTTAELVADVAAGVDAYARYLEGETEPWVDISDLSGGSLTASNAARLVEEIERDVAVLVRRSDARLAELLALAQTRSLDEIVPWHGQPEPLRCHLGSSLGEVLLHGRDLAAAIGAPWEISKREATLVIQNIAPLFPTLVNPHTTRTVHASIRVKIRGGPTIPLVFDCGSLTLDRRREEVRCDHQCGTRRLPSRRVRPSQSMVGDRARRTRRVGTAPVARAQAHDLSREPVSARPLAPLMVGGARYLGCRGSSGGTIGRLPVPSTNAHP